MSGFRSSACTDASKQPAFNQIQKWTSLTRSKISCPLECRMEYACDKIGCQSTTMGQLAVKNTTEYESVDLSRCFVRTWE